MALPIDLGGGQDAGDVKQVDAVQVDVVGNAQRSSLILSVVDGLPHELGLDEGRAELRSQFDPRVDGDGTVGLVPHQHHPAVEDAIDGLGDVIVVRRVDGTSTGGGWFRLLVRLPGAPRSTLAQKAAHRFGGGILLRGTTSGGWEARFGQVEALPAQVAAVAVGLLGIAVVAQILLPVAIGIAAEGAVGRAHGIRGAAMTRCLAAAVAALATLAAPADAATAHAVHVAVGDGIDDGAGDGNDARGVVGGAIVVRGRSGQDDGGIGEGAGFLHGPSRDGGRGGHAVSSAEDGGGGGRRSPRGGTGGRVVGGVGGAHRSEVTATSTGASTGRTGAGTGRCTVVIYRIEGGQIPPEAMDALATGVEIPGPIPQDGLELGVIPGGDVAVDG
mmetsp:Transcript_32490/g.95772  ORF Transcript_32490/g.95772 Transcript_32490/m.95772 type:complete len:387 (+) Transcript_32490:309-1469(+)